MQNQIKPLLFWTQKSSWSLRLVFSLPLRVAVDVADYSLLSLWKNCHCYGDREEQPVDDPVLAPSFAQAPLLDTGYKRSRKERRDPHWHPQQVTIISGTAAELWNVSILVSVLLTVRYLGLFIFPALTQVIIGFFLDELIPDSHASRWQERPHRSAFDYASPKC